MLLTPNSTLRSPFNSLSSGIQEARRDAMAVTKKGRSHKVDPTDALPVDVILLVFENFEIKELLVCATVSRHWHRYILNLPVWSRLHVDLLQTSISTMRARQQGLAKVLGPELRVIHIKTDASLFTILSLLSKAGCTNVKKFDLISSADDVCEKTPNEDTIFISKQYCSVIRGLAVSSRYLTDLRICSMMLPSNLTVDLLSLCPSLKLLSCIFPPGKERDTTPRLQLPLVSRQNTSWINSNLQVLQTPYSTHGLSDLAHLPFLKALILCGPWELNAPFQTTLRRLFRSEPENHPEVRHLSLLKHGLQGAELDQVLVQSQKGNGGLQTARWDGDIVSFAATGMVYDFIQHIQANRDTLVHLDCPINFMYDALQLDEIDGPPLTFPSLRTARLSDTPVNNQEGGRVLLEFLVLAPQLQEVQYTPDQSINHAPSIGDAILRISPVRRVIFKFHVGDRGLNLLGDLADTIATRGLAYHVERLQVPVLCYHADPARKANGEPWEQVVKSGHVARVKCLNVTIDCVNGNSCHTRASTSIIQRFCQNLVDVGANMTLEELALPPIHPSDFDICRRMMEGTCVVLRRFTFSSKA